MGIKRAISLDDIPLKYQKYNLIPTSNGVSATVYLLGSDYVLKLFEPDSTIEDELKVLNSLNSSLIPKVVDSFKIDNLQALIYTQIQGDILKSINSNQIEEIGAFLRYFHQATKGIDIKRDLYSNIVLKDMVEESGDREILNYFDRVSIELKFDGVIHGDLFLDNCKFRGGTLSGIFDFSDVSLGDFYFDLAVVAVGSSFREDILDIDMVHSLLDGYGANIEFRDFRAYIYYTLLYYGVLRFLNGRDYRELFARLDRL